MKAGAVIVGASHAGTQLAASLRQSGWADPIHLVSRERDLPYHRPPLSKDFLTGDKVEDQILLRGEGFYRDQGIDLLLGTAVTEIDTARRVVTTELGTVPYTALVLATGASARRLPLPGASLDGVHVLRDIADARALKARLAAARDVVVIGGGFIGLEVAATAAKAGKAVTVIEAQDRLIARALPPFLSAWLKDLHAGHGVDIRFGSGVEAFLGNGTDLTHVRLSDGRTLPADLALVGVGSIANGELAAGSGLQLEAGGIRVGPRCEASAPDVYAIGDCAAQHNRHTETVCRVESVQNATDQARLLAAHLTGNALPSPGTNWFWTDQYSVKLQMAGIVGSAGEILLRGDPASETFSLLEVLDGRLVSAFSVNRAADHMAARKLIAAGAQLDLHAAIDPAVPLMKATSPAAAE